MEEVAADAAGAECLIMNYEWEIEAMLRRIFLISFKI
jgi:hypothetical protein